MLTKVQQIKGNILPTRHNIGTYPKEEPCIYHAPDLSTDASAAPVGGEVIPLGYGRPVLLSC